VIKIFDQIENEADRLMKKEGRGMKAVYLGKKEFAMLVEELMDIQETPENLKANTRQAMAEADIVINDDVKIIPTNKDTELRVVPKEQMFN
jgi:PHD/YefM family antitoxin component YafN of YafNO toxin-antitoxin module